MADKADKEKIIIDACRYDEATQTVLYINDSSKPTICFNFTIKRQKSAKTNREQLVITATEVDGTLMGEITTTIPSLQEGLLGLREYGVVVPRAVYGKVAKCIEQNYWQLKFDVIEFEHVLTDEILHDILIMIYDYIEENTSDTKTYESVVKCKACYNIPVTEFAEIFKDSEFNVFELIEIKKALKANGFSICSTGRYDRTIYNSDSKKADKVICIDKDAIITILPELPDNDEHLEKLISTLPTLPDSES